MKCSVRYRHPVTRNEYYFVDFRPSDGELKPVGRMPYKREWATVFSTKHEAKKVRDHLLAMGYLDVVITVITRNKRLKYNSTF